MNMDTETINKMRQLRAEGKTLQQIADTVGLRWPAQVYQALTKARRESGPLQTAPTMVMEKDAAKQAHREYASLVKTRKEQYIRDLKQVYWHLAKGEKVLDIYEVFNKTGVNEQGDPKLAIVRADRKSVVFRKDNSGTGSFRCEDSWHHCKSCIDLPVNTFPDFPTEQPNPNSWPRIIRERITTQTPIIPAHLVPSGSLDNYFILWEVPEWKPVPTFKDPFLLKRINKNTFVVLAEWDLTPLEQAVIRGL
ncbi:MAG TPA: hypothetical protein VFD58_36610 [Blastocatellia bacterium]|nr:hypothetical protein [Blastocatellia bacterium]